MEGRGTRGMADAVSEDEGGVVGEEGVLGDLEQWEQQQDSQLLGSVSMGRGRRGREESAGEVFALSGTDSDSDLELPTVKKLRKKQKKAEKKKGVLTGMSESDLGSEEEEEEGDSRRWGSKKQYYYGGNTGEEQQEELQDSDLEEDRIEEQEAAKLQTRQLELMDEEDFMDAFVVKTSEAAPEKVEETKAAIRDLTKLSRKEQSKLFRQQNPEFAGVVADYQLKMAEAVKLSRVAALASAGSLPRGPVLEYVRDKLELLLNYCTNITAYLMFKSRGASLTLHPVTGRLVQYRQLLDQLQQADAVVMPQVEQLLSRLEAGESIQNVVKEEKRKARRESERNKSKPLKFGQIEMKSKEKKKKKRKAEDAMEQGAPDMTGLTLDEIKAVELFKAIKSKKSKKEEELGIESEVEDPAGSELDVEETEDTRTIQDGEAEPTYNDGNENIGDEDEEEKRAITYKIAKNKGLTPKRSKLQRNPRVKNRMKFEKAKKRRKGAVREIRDQSQKYGGEVSGINKRVKKGVKIQ